MSRAITTLTIHERRRMRRYLRNGAAYYRQLGDYAYASKLQKKSRRYQ